MSSFKLLIEKFDAILKQYNLPNYKKLYPSLDESEINGKLKKLNVMDEDFKTLYLWKNGYDAFLNFGELCQIFDRDTFLPLDTVIGIVSTNKN